MTISADASLTDSSVAQIDEGVRRPFDVLTQQLRRQFRIAAERGDKHTSVLGHDVATVVHERVGPTPVELRLLTQLSRDVLEALIWTRREQRLVELLVHVGPLRVRSRWVVVRQPLDARHAVIARDQCGFPLEARGLNRELDHPWLDQQPRLDELVEQLRRDQCHGMPVVWDDPDQALAHERGQRFACHTDARVVRRAKFREREPLPRPEHPGEDVVAQPVADVLRPRAASRRPGHGLQATGTYERVSNGRSAFDSIDCRSTNPISRIACFPLTRREVEPVRITASSERIEDLVHPSAELELLAEGFVFIEGPVWEQSSSSLLFSDIQNDTCWRWSANAGAVIERRPNFIGNGMVFDRDQNLLVCEHVTSSVVSVAPNGCRRLVAYHYEGRYLNSPNDVITRSDGTVFFTDPDYGRWEHAVGVARPRDLDFLGLFRVPPGGEVELAAPPDTFNQPNGLCFSPDESTLYVNDLDGIIRAFQVASDATLSEPWVLRSGLGNPAGGYEGAPDGMKCDADGNIWCTGWGGVWVIDPGGELLGVIETPEVTGNLAWGGPDWRTLYLCTATTLHSLRTKVPSARLPYH